MHLNRIKLGQFRNYSCLDFYPSKNINYIYGENAQGKTNILEGIYYLLSGHSFKTRHDRELINWEANYFNLQGELKISEKSEEELNKKEMKELKDDHSHLIKIYYSLYYPKKIILNGQEKSKESLFTKFPVVVFYPEDLGLIKEGPLIRRKFLNREISRWNEKYWETLKNYYRVLKQRNSYLKGVPLKKGTLDLWNGLLASYGSKLIYYRWLYLKNLEHYLNSLMDYFSSGKEKVKLKYRTIGLNNSESLNNKGELNDKRFHDLQSDLQLDLKSKDDMENEIYECIYQQLKYNQQEEFRKGYTLAGPHLDDFSVLLNEKDSQKYSSQGQQRTIILSLKLAQLELLKEKSYTPVLLLDDVFSELDTQRRQLIIRFLEENRMQCFITGYEKEIISSIYSMSEGSELLTACSISIFKIKQGELSHESAWELA